MDPSIFERATKRPVITSAAIQKASDDLIEVRVNLKSSQWKDDTTSISHCSMILQVDGKTGQVKSKSTPIPFDPQVHIFTACAGNLTINGLQVGDKPMLQICSNEAIRQIPLEDKCSALCNDPYFGFTDWSADGKKFIFQGERVNSAKMADKFLYRPSWGERLAKNYSVGLFILDVETGEVTELASKDNPSQALINEDRIWYVDQHELHYGLFYCFNRPSRLKSISMDGSDERVHTGEDEAINLPSKGDGCIWFLTNALAGSHHQSSTLCRLDVKSGQVTRFPSPEPHGFFIALFFKSFVQSGDPIYGIDKGCQRVIVKHDGHTWHQLTHTSTTWSPMHRHGDYILALESTRTMYPRLMLYNGHSWHCIYEVAEPSDWPANLELETKVQKLSDYVEMVILKPKGTDNLPCIMMPHGGPNDCYADEWSLYQWIFAQHGMACISVNFTGSTGYGAGSVTALEGQIGKRDVQDVMDCLDRAIADGVVDKDRVFLYSGSHGGFIIGWLTALYSHRFKAVCMRNPVLDLPSNSTYFMILGMTMTSDIWDWGAGQMGLKYDMHHPLPISDLQTISPSSQVQQVKCPTLLLLGTHDLRVPASQGIMWYRWLKGQGVPVQLYMFPEAGHALDTPEGERWSNLLTLQWFTQYL